MEFKHDQKEQYHILQVSGRFDINTAAEFEAEIQKCISDGHNHIVVDLSDLEYISSAGLRSILIGAKSVKAAQGEMRFCSMSGMVEEVFTVSGFKSMFKIFDSVSAATSA